MKLNMEELRLIQGELDKKGVCTNIQRVDKKQYNLVVNFEVVRTAKTRITLKRDIAELYNEHCAGTIQIYTYQKKGRRKAA